MTKTSVAVMSPSESGTSAAVDATPNPSGGPMCKNCHTLTTPLWRRNEHGAVLCNACGLFLKLHGRPRPISLKTDVIKPRNRKSTHSAANSSPIMLHQSGSESRKKETKKRKIQDPREISAAETLETILQFENGPRQPTKLPDSHSGEPTAGHGSGVGNMHVWRKIVPAAGQTTSPSPLGATTPQSKIPAPQHINGPLPHLSILLESVKTADERSQSQAQRIQEVPTSSVDPEILKQQYQEQRGLSSPPPQSNRNQAPPLASPNASASGTQLALSHPQSNTSQRSDSGRSNPSAAQDSQFKEHSRQELNDNYQNVSTQPNVASTRAGGEVAQVPQMHMASINEILNNQKPTYENSGIYVSSMSGKKPGSGMASRAQSPELHSGLSNGHFSHVLQQNSLELAGVHQSQSGSQTSDSPPPIDIQTSGFMGPSPSKGNNSALKGGRTGGVDAGQQRKRSEREMANSQQQLEEGEKPQQRSGTDYGANTYTHASTSRGSRHSSDEAPTPSSASLISLLQGQEEMIKLKTRISELELVTDLYKRHILELDAKCRGLEEKLYDVGK
ncbi:LAME_0G19086g1_1 [Lachancea meyersii CBS 8951]|uniref:LAME_0G19086g1_1 n=1 Tax=Lachancea meyersii CBS 8951 TaxID=1266667 RepID=A0A1G4KC43_9SACH|nr:LAME_0G19086g1_1 [Lachancea meyersii CBS 8951]